MTRLKQVEKEENDGSHSILPVAVQPRSGLSPEGVQPQNLKEDQKSEVVDLDKGLSAPGSSSCNRRVPGGGQGRTVHNYACKSLLALRLLTPRWPSDGQSGRRGRGEKQTPWTGGAARRWSCRQRGGGGSRGIQSTAVHSFTNLTPQPSPSSPSRHTLALCMASSAGTLVHLPFTSPRT
ncbi:hypothetical protein H920_03410 [Fukomys damarensis]|uniref:Uncharacterized protein n=1 Tax=Fukomys damarensis TaxID=885580 RepID=A0A091DYC8_FUKDA|nr:hypothetical protein H920_03410 [Fukomys damarensis]